MRAVIQRVSEATVTTSSGHKNSINKGLVVLLGIENDDNVSDIEWLSGKISRLRIFDDHNGVMNLSVNDVDGDIMVISQFTLCASVKKGNRPSYIKAAIPDIAIPIYEKFLQQIEIDTGKPPKSGIFGDYMQINLTNDGPVTILFNTRNKE